MGVTAGTSAPPPGGGRPVFLYVDTGPRTENFAHWEGESAIFLERWRCVKAHYPTARLLLEKRRRFKTMLLAALFDVREGDLADVQSWALSNGGAGGASHVPCERGNVVLLPPLLMLNQWTTDIPMEGALVTRYFDGYARRFGHAPGCPAKAPAAAAHGGLLMLPHGRVNNPASLEDVTPTADVEYAQVHHRNTFRYTPGGPIARAVFRVVCHIRVIKSPQTCTVRRGNTAAHSMLWDCPKSMWLLKTVEAIFAFWVFARKRAVGTKFGPKFGPSDPAPPRGRGTQPQRSCLVLSFPRACIRANADAAWFSKRG